MPPLRTILSAADLSEDSIDAFRIACSLAARDEALVSVLHVIDRDRDEGARPSPGIAALAATRKEQMRQAYVTGLPIEVTYRTSEGPVAVEILRTADEVGADLIAMATHGRTGLRRQLAGSVAESVLREARCPVMALHSHEGRSLSSQIRVILHAMSIWDDWEYALRAACTLAANLGARLVILHVSPRGVLMDGSLTPRIEPGFYRPFLAEARREAEGSDLEYPADIRLTWGDITDEILSTAKEVGCDLIVMGAHGRSWPRRLLMGSVAESVLHRADCPVLLIRAPREETSDVRERAADEAAITSAEPPDE